MRNFHRERLAATTGAFHRGSPFQAAFCHIGASMCGLPAKSGRDWRVNHRRHVNAMSALSNSSKCNASHSICDGQKLEVHSGFRQELFEGFHFVIAVPEFIEVDNRAWLDVRP